MKATPRWTRRDILIVFLLGLFAIQCVRSDFFVNESSGIVWSNYAAGTARMPYQGRVGMVPVLRWAEHDRLMLQGAAKYQAMMIAGSKYEEPVNVEKFASLLVGLLMMLALLGYCIAYGRRRGFRPWWLPSVLTFAILTISLSVRSEHNVWTPYDLPHTALFGIAVMCAFHEEWLAMLALFAVDVPVRETSIFLVAIAVWMSYLTWRETRGWWVRVGGMAVGMTIYWAAWRVAIQHRFAHNPTDLGTRFTGNLHELLLPHHWPQMACAGGYLIAFIWLERKWLNAREKALLYATLVCAPVTLYFGVWGETRIWLEWSLPWAVLAALEAERWMDSRIVHDKISDERCEVSS